MTALTVTAALITVVAAVLVPLIRRDLEHARSRRVRSIRVTLTIDTSKYVEQLRRAADALSGAELPAARAAADLERAVRQLRAALDAGMIYVPPEPGAPGPEKPVI